MWRDAASEGDSVRRVTESTTVAYLGPPGTFTEEALLGEPDYASAEILPQGSLSEVLDSLHHGRVDLGFVPLENAIEGCVRETYGAVVNLVEARASSDPVVRKAMRSIADDECRHAELAWAVAAWLRPRLTREERDAIERATREAMPPPSSRAGRCDRAPRGASWCARGMRRTRGTATCAGKRPLQRWWGR